MSHWVKHIKTPSLALHCEEKQGLLSTPLSFTSAKMTQHVLVGAMFVFLYVFPALLQRPWVRWLMEIMSKHKTRQGV